MAVSRSRPSTCSRCPAPAVHSMLVGRSTAHPKAAAAHAAQTLDAGAWRPYNMFACSFAPHSNVLQQQVFMSTATLTAIVRSRRFRRASTKVRKQLASPATSIRAANLRNLQQSRVPTC